MRKAGIVLVLFTWLAALVYAHVQNSEWLSERNQHRDRIVLPPFSQIDPRLINIFTFGHRGIYDDFIHIWFNHYLVDEAHLQKHPDDAVDIANILLRLRPMIESSYMLTCIAFLKDLQKPEYCEPIMQTGMRIFPKSFMLPMAQGFILYKELNDPIRAARYYAIAAQTEQAPPHVIRVAEKLLRQQELSDSETDQMLNDFDLLLGRDILMELKKKQEDKSND